ncbi:MAG: LemA family protein [Bacteroidaceae bacterium]|nr:LemA family protein [Bacteroidaceae bacterium]
MSTGLIFLIVVLLIAGGIFLWFMNTQRELVNLDEKAKNALSQIEVQLNSRWDALLNLARTASQYAQHESETLIQTIQARRGSEVKTAADIEAQQHEFSGVLSRLLAVSEAYPDLKANDLFAKTMNAVNGYEENVRMSRMIYNDSATRMNRYVRQWPSSFVANMLHFSTLEYLKVDKEEKRDAPVLFGDK